MSDSALHVCTQIILGLVFVAFVVVYLRRFRG
jgi:hypothetical protein